MGRSSSKAILFELLRSYTVLARTLNLSKAVRELGSTRQTVRRHINLLEEYKGEKLFRLEDRQYHLTEAGKASLKGAVDLLESGDAWLDNRSGGGNGLEQVFFDGKDTGVRYHLQQHPLLKLWEDGSELLQLGFKSWVDAKGDIENPAFSLIRPYLMVFRQHEDSWICVETGQKSAYATWHGWRWQRSCIGRDITEMINVPAYLNHMLEPFRDVRRSGSVRFDHLHTEIPARESGELTPVSYQRLLMGCHLPDGSFALGVLIERTYNIDIPKLDPEQARLMPKEYLMNIRAAELLDSES